MSERTRHDGDCYFYSMSKICTCGYLHYWLGRMETAPAQAIEQMETHEDSLTCAAEHREEYERKSEERRNSPGFKEAMARLESSFAKNYPNIKREPCRTCGKDVLVHLDGRTSFHLDYKDQDDPTTRFICPGGSSGLT